MQVGGAALAQCTYGAPQTRKYGIHYSGAAGLLSLRLIENLPSLHQLLAVLQPAGMPLLQLSISGLGYGSQGSSLQPLLRSPGALDGCSQLAALTSLSLLSMGYAEDPAAFDRVLQALLQQAPQLASLNLRNLTQPARLHMLRCSLPCWPRVAHRPAAPVTARLHP